MGPEERIKTVPASHLNVAKDIYLQWKEYADRSVWTSHALWANLTDKHKLWWVDFTIDTHARFTRVEFDGEISPMSKPLPSLTFKPPQ